MQQPVVTGCSIQFEDLYIVTELMDTDLLQVIRSSQVIERVSVGWYTVTLCGGHLVRSRRTALSRGTVRHSEMRCARTVG